jgi:hypothetical protein
VRVSQYFKLGRTQPYLDFVDVPLDTDVAVFLDPTAIRQMESAWGHECKSLIQTFFESVLRLIRDGRDADAQRLLASLNERNEFHLGYSAGESRGHGFGEDSAKWIWSTLTRSKAAATGLLRDLEDTVLMIPGIGPDMLSDAVSNIIRGPLLRYTQDMCAYYGIPTMADVDSGPIWNPVAERWDHVFLPLPVTKDTRLVLVPKILVRRRIAYDYTKYYRHYLLPAMQREELNANSGLVQVLRDGSRRVTKKALMEKYGADKLAVVRETIKRPDILERYRKDKVTTAHPPLVHDEIAEIEGTALPDFEVLYNEIAAVPVGREHAPQYEARIERLLSALFYPALCNPTKQDPIHDGRKRIDITYVNVARRGFFAWAAQHYPCALMFAECKNYGKEVGNPDIDQLAGRFGPSRGTIGLLVCRSVADMSLLMKRCKDTAGDHRGFIIPLEDRDLARLIKDHLRDPHRSEFPLLRERFEDLIKN